MDDDLVAIERRNDDDDNPLVPPTIILDIDGTIIEGDLTSECVPFCGCEYKTVRLNSSATAKMQTDDDGKTRILGSFFVAVLRPGILEFMNKLKATFRLAVCSTGARPYVAQIVSALDPDCSLFGDRILDREDLGPLGSKFVPLHWGEGIAIDDQPHVWRADNFVIKINPFCIETITYSASAEYLSSLYQILIGSLLLQREKIRHYGFSVRFRRALTCFMQHLDPSNPWFGSGSIILSAERINNILATVAETFGSTGRPRHIIPLVYDGDDVSKGGVNADDLEVHKLNAVCRGETDAFDDTVTSSRDCASSRHIDELFDGLLQSGGEEEDEEEENNKRQIGDGEEFASDDPIFSIVNRNHDEFYICIGETVTAAAE